MSGKNLGVDATTLEADPPRCARSCGATTGASYDEHVAALMKAEGMEEPTAVERQR
ncbi:MAG: hypothetical protein IPJ98_20540 [Bryobacterales bacterium]|nr:hypothetical protein [Bryobacterales bacterium]